MNTDRADWNKLRMKIINWWNKRDMHMINILNTWTNERGNITPHPIKQIVANYYNNLLLCLLEWFAFAVATRAHVWLLFLLNVFSVNSLTFQDSSSSSFFIFSNAQHYQLNWYYVQCGRWCSWPRCAHITLILFFLVPLSLKVECVCEKLKSLERSSMNEFLELKCKKQLEI